MPDRPAKPASGHEVWYLMPSASPENAARCVPAWRDLGYRVALLEDRTPIDVPCDAKLSRATYPGWAASINALFREVVPESCRVVVAGGDDMLPDPNHTAAELAEQFLGRFPDTFGMMQPTGDAFEATDTICGSPWMGRGWMRRMYNGAGGLCESYHQQFADEELFWVARCADRLWLRPDLTHRHEHFRRIGKPAPAYWVESAAAHERTDCLTFIARSHAGFPGAAPEGMLDHSVFVGAYDGRAERRFAEIAGARETQDHASARLARAIDRFAAEGVESVAVYGAGQHTRRCGDALARPTVRVRCIIDDDPARIGSTLWNYPIVSRDEAINLVKAGEISAVIVSSDAMEQALIAKAEPLRRAGAKLVSLYEPTARSVA